ncbi:MAG: hypothetical protein KGN74_13035 [Gemmatimonadota bacterium]|nr:hypothetical protein [Gemmatimonadota bacterium]
MRHTQVRRITQLMLVAAALAAPAVVRAQDFTDRFSFHGSLVWGYGKSDGLPVFGVNKDGTTDYRALALQFRYAVTPNDEFVTQLLSRALGTSPLDSVEPSMFPVWAYYQHKSGDWTFKVGRDPLPRGIFNEVRFIGTLLPFYRVGADVYGETLEAIDGIVVSRDWDLGRGWGAETHFFAGGTDLNVLLPSNNGVGVVSARLEDLLGTQLWLNTPIQGLRAGAFVTGYQPVPAYGTSNPDGRQYTTLYSLDGNFTHFFTRAEFTEFSGQKPGKSDYTSWYGMAGIKVNDKVTLAGQYMETRRYIDFGAPVPPVYLKENRDMAGSVAFAPSANLAFKLEAHHVSGYSFDTNVPTFIPPTAPPFNMGIAPASKANYMIASVAISF